MPTIMFTAVLENLDNALKQVRYFSHQHRFTHTQQMEIELALEEIIVNIINHAYPASSPGEIEISYSCAVDGGLVIKVADYAFPYNPLQGKNPDLNSSLKDRAEGGLGVFLLNKMVDKISYQYENKKNILTLVKYRK
jgi:anti-sigma regulatory factor (Ser/Thr protein kinase)